MHINNSNNTLINNSSSLTSINNIILLIKYGNKACKILKENDKPINIRTYNIELTYIKALELIKEEYVLITEDYFLNKFKEIIKIKENKNELLIEIENKKWKENYKLINKKILIRKKIYKEIISKLFEYITINNNDITITDVKYFNKKVIRKMKSLSVNKLNSNNFHLVMNCKYDSQICNITPISISYILLYLIDIKLNETIGILDDIKGVLAFSIYERINNNNNKIIYFSKNSHLFIYNKNIYFNKRDDYLKYNFNLFFIASSYNKIQLINSINSDKFVIFISNLTELQQVSSFLFENIDKFTDISIKELLSRELEIKEYGNIFIHPKIKGRLGNGWIISFITINNL